MTKSFFFEYWIFKSNANVCYDHHASVSPSTDVSRSLAEVHEVLPIFWSLELEVSLLMSGFSLPLLWKGQKRREGGACCSDGATGSLCRECSPERWRPKAPRRRSPSACRDSSWLNPGFCFSGNWKDERNEKLKRVNLCDKGLGWYRCLQRGLTGNGQPMIHKTLF